MAHYAELGVDNIVKRCLYITTKDCMTEGGIEKEEIGRTHLETHHGGTWVKYSYNTTEGVHLQGKTPFRANAPSPGWYYDSTHDIFYPPRPKDKDGESCDSWTLNTTTGVWQPPITRPTEGDYYWDESVYKADNTKGWILISTET